ncbi:MAG: DNA-binding response regulator [Rhizobiaceae bacterium]|nr:MAG: DNA-binding response regulator [Rhizobiaceae bacterium]CAG0991640.1 hypothetical protein RHIZO_02283 [Rhizobiaceae bacterium]
MVESSGGARILVVVPDAPVRQSLRFVLEAEGYGVLWLDQLPPLPAPEPGNDAGYDCAVVDEDAIQSLPGGWQRLRSSGLPLVLLVDRLGDGAVEGVHSVRKPLLGSALIDAVRVSLQDSGQRPNGAAT